MKRIAKYFLLLAALTLGGPACGQGTADDYERAAKLFFRTRNKVFRAGIDAHWFDDGKRFWYRNDLKGETREFVLVDAAAGKRENAFDHGKLAAALAKATGKKIAADRLPIEQLRFSSGAKEVYFRANGKAWRLDRTTHDLREEVPAEKKPLSAREKQPLPQPPPRSGEGAKPASGSPSPLRGGGWGEGCFLSPSALEPVAFQRRPRRNAGESQEGQWAVVVKDHNVHLLDRTTKTTVPLSKEGIEADGYTREIYWSPDSKRFVAMRRKAGFDRKIHFVESSPRDQVQPKLHTMSYRKPGDAVPIRKPHLFDVETRKETPINDELFANPWDLGEVRWEADSKRFTFVYNQRGHQVLRVVAVDAAAGKATALVDESSKTFIDYAHKQYLHWLDETHELIWMSERDGWNHLYLYDAKTGKVKNQITKGDWVVRDIRKVDAKKRQVWFRACGIRGQKQDPYYLHHARINFDGTGLVILTEGDGTHEVDYSPGEEFLIDTYSRVDLAPVTELRRASDGKLMCKLEEADPDELKATGWQTPERFVAKGRDGKTDIYGVIFRPTTFDAKKKYPVIENVYAGPHGSFAPKRFQPFHHQQAMAELGFIIVQMDGMGTSNRSKAFHDVCWKNLGDSGFPDRIAWIKAAAKKHPCMDLTRVGIYGGSAGGQSSTRALLAHGDFYKVGVSDCGCHDNRVDKIWWNELWMGYPVGPHYREQSNAANAHKLQGKLLLIVGEMDRNVDPASTMQVVNALVKANKDFDMLVIPGAGHGAAGTPYGRRRQQDYFVRHLLGVEPRRPVR